MRTKDTDEIVLALDAVIMRDNGTCDEFINRVLGNKLDSYKN